MGFYGGCRSFVSRVEQLKNEQMSCVLSFACFWVLFIVVLYSIGCIQSRNVGTLGVVPAFGPGDVEKGLLAPLEEAEVVVCRWF